MKRLAILTLVVMIGFSANATVRIGTPDYDPPYVIHDQIYGDSGFDIDLMSAICKRLQWDCQFIPMNYLKLYPALQNNDIDFAIGSLVITRERQTTFLFSTPYLLSEAGFLVMKKSSITQLSDLQGKTIGAVQGKAYLQFLQDKFSSQLNIIPYDDFSPLALDIHSGKIDAIFMNYMTAQYLAHQYPANVLVLKDHFSVGYGLGIATLPSNQNNIDLINHMIISFESDGTFARLYNFYFQFIPTE